MKVRLVFTSEIYLEGDSMSEIREKWENFPTIYSTDAVEQGDAGFCDLVAVEDGETFDNVETEFFGL
jgi:hypothetical protein